MSRPSCTVPYLSSGLPGHSKMIQLRSHRRARDEPGRAAPPRLAPCTAVAAVAVLLLPALPCNAFSARAAVARDPPRSATRTARRPPPGPRALRPMPQPSGTRCMSSVGGGNDEGSFGEGDFGNGDGDGDNGPLNEWMRRSDSSGVRRLREQLSEGRLPISYGAMNMEDEDDDRLPSEEDMPKNRFGPVQGDAATAASSSSSSLSRAGSGQINPYLEVVSRLTPSELIAKFTASASPRVQDAVRTTILGLLGGLPQMAFTTRTVATGERLASLMFQLQMTGYMFKNAEYRLSLRQSLGAAGTGRGLPGADDDAREYRAGARVRGKIKVRYGGGSEVSEEEGGAGPPEADGDEDPKGGLPLPAVASSPGMELEVDAQAYTSELRAEVSRLREALDVRRQAKEEELRKDLLMYIKTLPPQELQQLTGTMSPEVLEAMKGLVAAVLAGIGDPEGVGATDQKANNIGADTVTEQSGEALAQLCMWQLVVGFNLRELEVRNEFRSSMRNVIGGSEAGQKDMDGEQFG